MMPLLLIVPVLLGGCGRVGTAVSVAGQGAGSGGGYGVGATQVVLVQDGVVGVDEWLEKLQKRGDGLVDFDAKVKLTDRDALTGDESVREGTFVYHVQPDGMGTKLRVTLPTRDSRPEKIEYLLDGKTLVDRNYRRKIEVRRVVLKEGQKMNLLKLGEGPFPLPIGQDPKEVKRQFEVSMLVVPTAENPVPVLRLVPKVGTRMAAKFANIDVSVDPVSHFPVKIETVDVNKANVRVTELSGLRINPEGGIKDEAFVLPTIDKEWKVTEEPYSD